MEPTPFAALCQSVAELEQTSSRLEKRRIGAGFLKRLQPDEVAAGALLIIGRVFPDADARTLNVGWATLQRLLAELPPVSISAPLSLLEVYRTFEKVAATSGPDSQRARQEMLAALLGRATEDERSVLLRILSGEMRTGASEGLMIEAIAEASGAKAGAVRAASLFAGDVGRLARIALTEGEAGLTSMSVKLLEPVRPMLADLGDSPAGVLAEHGGETAVEFKLDGVRIQIHRSGAEVRIFSRRLTEVTQSIPEMVEWARTVPADNFLVEGEVVAVDGQGRPRPFQEVMRRMTRVHDIDASRKEIPLELRLFDLLWLNGRSFLSAPYRERWAALEALVPEERRVPRLVTGDAAEIQAFLDRAMELGHEGLMAKDLAAPYAVGRRGKRWLKLKPAETLDVAILAAEWGHGRRQGTLSNYWLGVRHGEGWEMLGKTFKGLTDAERFQVMERLLAAKASETEWVVHVRPDVIVEVTYNEIQKSPRYASGYSLRFARVTRIRDDKGPAEADTYERVESLYQRQFDRKAR
jgi:DNA ligase-1